MKQLNLTNARVTISTMISIIANFMDDVVQAAGTDHDKFDELVSKDIEVTFNNKHVVIPVNADSVDLLHGYLQALDTEEMNERSSYEEITTELKYDLRVYHSDYNVSLLTVTATDLPTALKLGLEYYETNKLYMSHVIGIELDNRVEY